MSSARRTWSTEHVFFVAVGCLFLGIFAGYLLRGDKSAPATEAAQQSAPAPAAQPNPDQQTPAQLAATAAQQAEPLLKRLKDEPKNAQLLSEIGNIFYDAKQYPQAISYYKQSLAIRPDDNVRTDMATACFYNGDPDTAIVELNSVLKSTPDHANALFNLGIVKWQGKSDPAGAAEAWDRLLKVHPDHPQRQKIESLLAEVRQQRASR